MRCRDESGQVSVLIIGFAVMLLLAVALVANASSAFLHRQELNSVADGAALHAADAGVAAALELGEDDRLGIDVGRASAAVVEYLNSVDASRRYPGLRHEVTVTADGAVLVRLRASVSMPLAVPGAPSSTAVTASARAAVTVLR